MLNQQTEIRSPDRAVVLLGIRLGQKAAHREHCEHPEHCEIPVIEFKGILRASEQVRIRYSELKTLWGKLVTGVVKMCILVSNDVRPTHIVQMLIMIISSGLVKLGV